MTEYQATRTVTFESDSVVSPADVRKIGCFEHSDYGRQLSIGQYNRELSFGASSMRAEQQAGHSNILALLK
jgi:hypothetical protein